MVTFLKDQDRDFIISIKVNIKVVNNTNVKKAV